MASLTPEALNSAYVKQRDYTLGQPEGSLAIASGRAAGLAKQLGLDDEAKRFWDMHMALGPKVADLPGDLPTLDQMYESYTRAPQNFARFANAGEFPKTPDLDFSNAAGAYAWGRDYLRRGKVALAGGTPVSALDGAAGALHAAGFDTQAAQFDRMAAVAIAAAQGPVSGSKTNTSKGIS